MSITVQDVEALRSLLAGLPRHEAREVTKQEAVALLASEIRAAQRRGYPPEEIARILSEKGVPINVATLRGYLRRTKSRPKRPATETAQAPSSKTIATIDDRAAGRVVGDVAPGNASAPIGGNSVDGTHKGGAPGGDTQRSSGSPTVPVRHTVGRP